MDLSVFKSKGVPVKSSEQKPRPTKRLTDPFVQIPCRIVARAGQTLKSAQDVVVLMHIVNRVRIENSREIKLTSKSVFEEFGVGRWAKWRALGRLEQAGFISVERERGKNPTVTLKPW